MNAIHAHLVLFSLVLPLPARAAQDSASGADREPTIARAVRHHWAFAPLRRPAVSAVKQADWPRNAVDRFVLARLEDAGLAPMPAADRATLIRRVTFDLTGLPPAPEDVEAFVRDRSPGGYERLVDRLLASPAYGERWAQHWLDLARFAETDGFEHDKLRPEAWRYRDWVISALNADVRYDEFVRLQLAGDEVRPGDSAAAEATGFLLCGPDMPDINLIEERRHSFLNDLTGTVGSVFLGLQIGCAQCHDHKSDPISQREFYRLRAFFDPAIEFEKNKTVRFNPRQKGVPESRLMTRGDFRRPGETVSPAFPRVANPWEAAVSLEANKADDEPAHGPRGELARWLTRSDHPLATRVVVNRIWQHHFGRGLSRSPSDFGKAGQPPTHPELLDWLAIELATRSGWSLKQLHRTIVTSATYRQASRPANPSGTVEQNRRAAERWSRARQIDPENDLFSRMPRRRLEGEAVRDAMLAASGRLNRRSGGPGVRPPLPKELVSTLLKGQWPVTPDASEHRRRSIYLFVRRNLRYPLFEVFDRPDGNESCPRRNRSTTAPQALMLLNSELSLAAARELSGYVLREAAADRSRQIELCYLRTLSRRPTAEERELAERFLNEATARLQAEARSGADLAAPDPLPDGADAHHAAALTDLCLTIFNLNEFVYID